MIKSALSELIAGKDMSSQTANDVMTEIMEGKATDAQIGAFLTALRLKGESIDEITSFASIMRSKASTIHPMSENLIDTCGTGGDSACTFNISTTVAFVLAAGGLNVAKHGNRSVSSKCGSADVLEALGVKIDLTPEEVEKSIDNIGIGFMFAPAFHKAMKYAIGPRREIGIRTVFNILGPLTNPANANYQIVGVYSPQLCLSLCNVLKNLGLSAAMVVHGSGLDEVTTTGQTNICELKVDGSIVEYKITPQDFGFNLATIDDLKTSSVEESAKIVMEILNAEQGPMRDIVALNSACAFKVAQKVVTIKEGVALAQELIESKKPLTKLQQLIDFSNST